MSDERPSLVDSPEHANECHQRWMLRRNRKADTPGYRDEWYGEQCMFCAYFIPLVGAFADDYGVCSNSLSAFDGIVRFEHDGCSEFIEGEWWQEKEKKE
jgi:hypothetical protein